MKKYTVELHATKSVEVEVESVLDAANTAKEQNPDFIVQGVYDGKEWTDISTCNGCEEYMVEGDDTGNDTDGNQYCADCFGAAKEDYLQWLGKVVDAAKSRAVALRDEQDEDYIDTLNELYGEHSDEPQKVVDYLIKHEMVVPL